MDEHLDTGPILLQDAVEIPEGIRMPELEHVLAELGGRLVVEALVQRAAGTAHLIPQDSSRATSAHQPGSGGRSRMRSRMTRRAVSMAQPNRMALWSPFSSTQAQLLSFNEQNDLATACVRRDMLTISNTLCDNPFHR
jgi:hypothetical protein